MTAKKNGRPRKADTEKKQQRSVYLSPSVLQTLREINPSVSLAVQQLCRERMDSEATARGTVVIEQLYHRRHPGTLATYIHTMLFQGKPITPAVARLLRMLGERDPLSVS